MTYGLVTERTDWTPTRSMIAEPEVSASGNLVLRIGHENERAEGGWQQTEHVVMVPDEAIRFARACLEALGQ